MQPRDHVYVDWHMDDGTTQAFLGQVQSICGTWISVDCYEDGSLLSRPHWYRPGAVRPAIPIQQRVSHAEYIAVLALVDFCVN